MNTLYSRNRDMEEDDDEPIGRDREMTLGTSFIVGIFFALVLICAIFFAFGYSLGKRSALPASGVVAPAASQDTGSSSAAKPSSAIPESQAASADSSTDTPADDSSSNEQTPPAATQTPVAVPAKLTIKPTPVSRAVAPSTPAVVPGAAQSVVQVAAVSRKGDADMLVGALKRHGYNAAIHQSPQDKLLHVQIGPFATKKDADAMRQKLTADGYNAIVK
ncbi:MULTISPECIES: SPOR domain-containing protein [Acidobacteriaceae]|uniref:SPOR domain-containing protein n=1 Tax=Acidobacteriaceae TaxID=204434 RepID=UPI00131B53BC|nr:MULTISPECIES: SPOR domain-containing protein [Acidobacteriaceae]MDW5264945.1 SPOR domain-containing protein [Edaphobacter sp.]